MTTKRYLTKPICHHEAVEQELDKKGKVVNEVKLVTGTVAECNEYIKKRKEWNKKYLGEDK